MISPHSQSLKKFTLANAFFRICKGELNLYTIHVSGELVAYVTGPLNILIMIVAKYKVDFTIIFQ